MKNNNENPGISLLKKGKKNLFSVIFSRMTLTVLLLLLQIYVLFSFFYKFEEFLLHFWGATILFMILMVLYLLNSDMDPTAKITWLVIILLIPVFGALFYLYVQSDLGHRALRDRTAAIIARTRHSLPQKKESFEALKKSSPGVAALINYINLSGCYPVYDNTDVTYFPLGENKFAEMLLQLEAAEHFIFLEYFIIDEGLMWGRILEILRKKAAQGVDVRVMYDGTCEFSTLPHNYPKKLEKLGIRCKAFAPVTPFFSTHYNYRDHRKILVIDGHTAFTGGVNLADEYINHIRRFGHWKDTAVMLKGEAARSFTLMFLQMWHLNEKQTDFSEYLKFPVPPHRPAGGFAVPYADCPVDRYKVGEQVYIDILNRAEHFVHIMSPYLILDSELENALVYAAQRGVDVRLILPGIPDKAWPYALAVTHYPSLIRAGVRIGEYTPGFVHAKVVVCDSREAVVGTINMDYRSLYHHFECAVYLWGVSCIPNIVSDFEATWNRCRIIDAENLRKLPLSRRLKGFLIKPLAPLM